MKDWGLQSLLFEEGQRRFPDTSHYSSSPTSLELLQNVVLVVDYLHERVGIGDRRRTYFIHRTKSQGSILDSFWTRQSWPESCGTYPYIDEESRSSPVGETGRGRVVLFYYRRPTPPFSSRGPVFGTQPLETHSLTWKDSESRKETVPFSIHFPQCRVLLQTVWPISPQVVMHKPLRSRERCTGKQTNEKPFLWISTR